MTEDDSKPGSQSVLLTVIERFLSNAKDEAFLLSAKGQARMAKALFEGILAALA